MSTREDDDIDYFGKCITGVSRVCSLPRAYLSLRGPGVALASSSQLLSVMELRTRRHIWSKKLGRDGEVVADSRTDMMEGAKNPREKVNTRYIERMEAARDRKRKKSERRTSGKAGKGEGERVSIRETRSRNDT